MCRKQKGPAHNLKKEETNKEFSGRKAIISTMESKAKVSSVTYDNASTEDSSSGNRYHTSLTCHKKKARKVE